MLTNPNYMASGNIYPSRFVVQNNQFRVGQATANAKVVGISQQGTRNAPGTAADDGYAAITDEPIAVYGPGTQCLLEIAATVYGGYRLAADADGKGVLATSGQNVGAIAEGAGQAGDKIRVFVQLQGQTA
jgi:hypothetical protein